MDSRLAAYALRPSTASYTVNGETFVVPMPERIKTLTSHAAVGRFMAECSDEPVREVPRLGGIPSPYTFSPTHVVYRWGDREVFMVETKHRHVEVFDARGLPTAPSDS